MQKNGCLKVIGDKNIEMVFRREERSLGEFIVDGMQLEHVSKFKYLGFV